MSKSTLFIGSSSESLKVAYAMQANLEGDFEVTVWNQGVFTLSHTVIEDLINNLSKFQFAVFIFSPDDVLHMREVEYVAVRDNVIFEMGLFMGRIGRDRTFFVLPSGTDKLRMPSDILGVSYAGYNPNRSDGNLVAALGPACHLIKSSVDVILNRDVAENYVSSDKASKVVRSETDYLILLKSWLNREPAKNENMILFLDVDQELGLPDGTTKNL